MSRRLIGLATVVVGATCLLAPPAHAAEEIGLSNDGTTWSSTLEHPLFDPAFRWVPGDSETASFYVRNQGPSSALLTIEARSAGTDELLDDDDIALRARAADGEWVSVENGVASRSLTSESIRRGDVVEVVVNATFDPVSTNQSQTRHLLLRLDVTLTDALEDGGGEGAGNDDGPGGSGVGSGSLAGLLPETGSATTWLALWVGALLAGLGLALAARRRQDDEVSR